MMRRLIVITALLLACPARAEVIYVDIDATGANDGTSWLDAYVDLQDALGRAMAGDEVRVAEGIYKPSQSETSSESFVVPSGVRMLGGFVGRSAPLERDWEQYTTRLSGLLVPWIPSLGQKEVAAHHVVVVADADSSTLVSGFYISGGRAYGGGSIDSIRGGGVLVLRSHARFEDCVIEDCRAAQFGGGVFIGAEASPSFRRCMIQNNEATERGGGLYSENRSADPRDWPAFTDVIFRHNGLSYYGAGMSGHGRFTRVTFEENTASDSGGGLSGGGLLDGVRFVANYAVMMDGGGMAGWGLCRLQDVEFVDNLAPGESGGGAIFYSEAILENVILQGNVASWGGGLSAYNGGVKVVNTLFAGNRALQGGAIVIGNSPREWRGDDLRSLSPSQFINCTVAGSLLGTAGEGPKMAVLLGRGGDLQFTNSVIWGSDFRGGLPSPPFVEDADLTFLNCIVEGSQGSGPAWNADYGIDLGGNLDVDPLFVDPAHGDYRLRAGSPAIDAGDTDALPANLLTDLDGNPRVIGASVDMGAYEASVPGMAGLFAARMTPRVLQAVGTGPELLVAVDPLWKFEVGDIEPGSLRLNSEFVPIATKSGPRQLRLRFEPNALALSLGVGRELPVLLSGALRDGTMFTAIDQLTILDVRGGPVAPQPDRPESMFMNASNAPRFHLGASPNPFNPSTTIRYGLAESGPVELAIYDLAGRRVRTLVSGHVAADEHEFIWDGSDARGGRVGSGVYLVRLNAPGFQRTIRLVLLK